MNIPDDRKQILHKIILKLWIYSEKVKGYYSFKTKRIIAKAKAEESQMAYIKVCYGKFIASSERIESFINEGTFANISELLFTLSAFLEKST